MSEQVETSQAAPEAQQPELTIQDLQNLRAIIDVASQRGAFKAIELAFNKLNDFLNAVAPAKPAGEPEQGQAEQPAA